MRAALALIRFELERRWLAPAVGLAFGLMSVALPYFPGGPAGVPANELRTVAGSLAVVFYAALLSIALGGSLVARDLAERRASFLFARPFGALAIASCRFLAALLIVLASAALIGLPSILAGARFELATTSFELLEGVALVPALAVAVATLLLLSSVVVLAARARTPWIVLEIGAIVAAALLVSLGISRLHDLYLDHAELLLRAGVAAGATIALAAIYLAVVARGRTDLARAHRAQAIAIALTFGGLGVGAYGWANDFVSPDFAEVVGRSDSAEALGDDLFVIAGSQPRREALSTAFVYDARNGRAVSAGPLLPFFSTGSRFVASGGRALFWPEQSRSTFRLARAERSPIGLAISETSIDLDPRTSPWAVSLDGERLATVAPTGNEGSFLLGVHEIGTGRLLSSTRVALSVSWQCRLAGEGDGFRLVGVDSSSNLESWRVERDGTARRTAHVPGAEIDFGWFLDAEGGRIFVKRAQPSEGWALLDSTSLEPIALLRPPILDQPGATLSFLVALFPDGSIGTAARTGARRELALFSASGELISSSTWPATGTTRFVGSGAQRTLLLATRTGGKSEASATGWTVERFDLDSGARRVVARDLLPMSTRPMTRPGQVLLRDENGRLFALEPDSGELRELPKTW